MRTTRRVLATPRSGNFRVLLQQLWLSRATLPRHAAGGSGSCRAPSLPHDVATTNAATAMATSDTTVDATNASARSAATAAVHEAMHAAVSAAEQLLRTLHRTPRARQHSNTASDDGRDRNDNKTDGACDSNNKRDERDSEAAAASNSTGSGSSGHVHWPYEESSAFARRWDAIQRSLALLGRVSTGNTVTPYRDSGDAFAAMWHAVDHATREVLWQTYICKDDHVGRVTVQKLLQARTQRHCDVELLYDCGGNISGRGRLTEPLRRGGARVLVYRPFFRSFARYLFRGLDWRTSPGLRNHRKILLVDGAIGFCGGLNIGNEYCGTRVGGTGAFRDTHCALAGPAVAHLREVYDDTKRPQPWKYGWQRWRQIASMALRRRYTTGRQALVNSAFVQQLHAVKQPDADGKATTAATAAHDTDTANDTSSETAHDTSSSKSSSNDTDNNDNDDSSTRVYFGSTTRKRGSRASCARAAPIHKLRWQRQRQRLEQLMHRYYARTTASAATASSSSRASRAAASVAMQRKVLQARLRALRRALVAATTAARRAAADAAAATTSTATTSSHALDDDAAVPEAAAYTAQRAATTQILMCNPRYLDYSIQYAYWQVTRKCQRRLWLTTPYYLPTRRLLKALLRAASRGVDVRVLSGSRHTTDPWFMWHASSYITERLLRAGVRVYEYRGREVMHAKTLVVDGVWSSIGSYNWDVMSNKNLEVCVCHLDATLACEMERHFRTDLQQSVEVGLDTLRRRPLWLRATAWLFYHGVYLATRLTFFSYSNAEVDDVADKDTRV